MRLTDYISPSYFAAWAEKALDHLTEDNVTRIVECSKDEGLIDMSILLEDANISREQVMAVLVALDLYLQDIVLEKGQLHEFPSRS